MSRSSILGSIAATLQNHATRPALFANGEHFSYRDLGSTARGIRDRLVDLGFAEAPRIGVVTSDDLHTYASLLAVWSLGAAYVPVNAKNPPDRNLKIISEAGLDVVITSRAPEGWSTHLYPSENTARIVHTGDVQPSPEALELPDVDGSHLAYLFFTSGSTGTPKGVPVSHANLAAFMDCMITRLDYGFGPEDRFLQMFELTFDLSVMTVFTPWCVGGCCYVVPDKGISYMNIADILGRREITVALMVPSILAYLKRFFDELDLPHLRLSLFCGEALMQDMVSEWSRCIPNARVENVYGPTEATIFCTTYPWQREAAAVESVNGIVPIGTAMPGTRTLIVDDDGRAVADGEKGELCLLGDQVMSGYWNDPEKTAAAFHAHANGGRAYRTGDICYVNENGNIVYCGRKDSQIKIDGHRIELGEIEHHARQFIASSQAAVVVVDDGDGQPGLRLFVGAGGFEKDALERHLRDQLPAYMCPRWLTVLEELPLNTNGKIDRPALVKLSGR